MVDLVLESAGEERSGIHRDRSAVYVQRFDLDAQGPLHDFLESKPAELYFVGSKSDPVLMSELKRWRNFWPPYRVLTVIEESDRERLEELLPAAEGKVAMDGKPTLYICHEGICEAPEVLSE